MSTGRLVVGVTGASGAIYAQRFLHFAAMKYAEIFLILSEQARQVAQQELDVVIDIANFQTKPWLGVDAPNIRLLNGRDFFTPPASGSFRHDGMVIVPCSMGTAGRIASGTSDDLMTRCADVCLKEGRPLIVVPREMPYSLPMLRNLTTLAESGAIVIPASPAWYHKPATVEDLADTVVARILLRLGVDDHGLQREWMRD